MTGTVPAFGLGRLPRITFGAGAIASLPRIVAGHGGRALLVTGGTSFRASPHAAALEAGLAEVGVTLVGSVSVSGEPGLADIEGPVGVYRGRGVEVVLGIGGGAAMDTAKAIAGLLPVTTELMDHLEGVGRGMPYPGGALPVVAVPTTAGTGSEATRNAVITERGADGFKRSFRHESMVPADAVVDPDLLATATPPLIAANGLDALTQLLESLTSRKATPFTDALARDGLAACRDGLLAWHADPDGPRAAEARSRMAYAALLSGVCLANAGLGAVHGLASPLGAHLPIAHGLACGAVLWQTTATNIAALEERDPASPTLRTYAEAGRILAGLGSGSDHVSARQRLVESLRDLVAALDVPPLSASGLTRDLIPLVVAHSPGSSMSTNPVPLTDAELARVLEGALEGG